MALGTLLAAIQLALQSGKNIYDVSRQEQEISSIRGELGYGDTPSWWQKGLGLALGPVLGGGLYSYIQQDKLAGLRTDLAERNATIGRRALGADLEDAARAEERAIQSGVGQQLAQALRASNIDAAQRGFFRSGETGQRSDVLRRAAMQDVAGAVARTRLEKAGLAQQMDIAEMNYNLQAAQLEMQRKAAQNAMYAQLAESAGYLIPSFLNRNQKQEESPWDKLSIQLLQNLLTNQGGQGGGGELDYLPDLLSSGIGVM